MTEFEIAGHKFYVKKVIYHRNDISYRCYNIRHECIISLSIYQLADSSITWYITTSNIEYRIGKVGDNMKSKTAKVMILDYLLTYHCY